MFHMVSYKLDPDRVAENERWAALVAYAALREARPAGCAMQPSASMTA